MYHWPFSILCFLFIKTSLAKTSSNKNTGLSCFDWRGRLIEDGAQFVPNKKDLCTACICNGGLATTCKSVLCSPPLYCPAWEQLSGECCRFICINSTTVSDGDKKSGGAAKKPESPPEDTDETTNIGLRLVASTVTSFLILALLLFMIHRLRRRRMLFTMRRINNNCRRENNSNDMVATAYVSEYDEINIGVEFPPYREPPPPYSPPRPNHLPEEAPPPYESPRVCSYETGEPRRNLGQLVNGPPGGALVRMNRQRRDSSSSDSSNDSVFVQRNISRNSVGTITDSLDRTNGNHLTNGRNHNRNHRSQLNFRQSDHNENTVRLEQDVLCRSEATNQNRPHSYHYSSSVHDNRTRNIDRVDNQGHLSQSFNNTSSDNNTPVTESLHVDNNQTRHSSPRIFYRSVNDDNSSNNNLSSLDNAMSISDSERKDTSDGSIILEDNPERKVVWQSSENSLSKVNDASAVMSDSENAEQDGILLSPSRFRISNFLDLRSLNKRHSSYDGERSPNTPVNRHSLPPMTLSINSQDAAQPLTSSDSTYGASDNNNLGIGNLESPEIYPGDANFHSPLTPIGSLCSRSNNSVSCVSNVQSPISPGTPVQLLGRSNSVRSQVSHASICSETGEPRPPRCRRLPSPAASSSSHDSDYVQDVSVQVGASIEQLNCVTGSTRNNFNSLQLGAPVGAVGALVGAVGVHGGARPKINSNRLKSHSMNRLSEELSSPELMSDAANEDTDANGNKNDEINDGNETRWVRHAQLGDCAVKKQYGFIDLPDNLQKTRDNQTLSFGETEKCGKVRNLGASGLRSPERKSNQKYKRSVIGFVKSKSIDSISKYVADIKRKNETSKTSNKPQKSSPIRRQSAKWKRRHSSYLENVRLPNSSTGGDLYLMASGGRPVNLGAKRHGKATEKRPKPATNARIVRNENVLDGTDNDHVKETDV